MKPPLTPEQKEHKRQRDTLQGHHNRLKMAFSMGKIRTWEEWYSLAGITTDISRELNQKEFTKSDLLYNLKAQTEELERKLNASRTSLEQNVPNVGASVSPMVDTSMEQTSGHPKTNGVPVQSASSASRDETKTVEHSELLNADNDYGLQKSPNENVFLFWFQKKAVKELYDGFIKHKLRGQLLLANTGTGKTFIAGALLRRLIDINFHEGKTWSHIPYLYVTRASVVEQTKRVFKNNFNIGVDFVEVVNIEALRSSVGRLWVKEEMHIEQGKEVYRWVWKKNINPCLMLLDECQSVKNPDSNQTEIVMSYAELPTVNNHVLFISATPFTRVSEAKAFVVNCHIETELI